MFSILPFRGREKEPENREKKVFFPQSDNPTNDTDKPKRRNSILSSRPKKPKKSPSSEERPQPQKSRFERATEIIAEDKAAHLQTLQNIEEDERKFWRKRNEEARQRYYGVTGGRPRYGWESPNTSKPSSTIPKIDKNTSQSKPASKLGNLKGLGRSQSLGVKSLQQGVSSPTPSTREVWNTLYAKNQEIHSLRLSHQEMLEELHAYQVGLHHHKRALDEARWESEECYQTLSLLNRLAGEGKRFDEKVWVERIQLRNRIKQLEEETKELRKKWEQCRQMLDSVDAIWYKEWEEKEILTQELKGARAENKRLGVELKNVCRIGGHAGPDSRSERKDSSVDGTFYDAPEGAGQAGSDSGSGKYAPSRVDAEGPRIPPRVSSLHWQNLARSASARREQFEKEERVKLKSVPKPNKSLRALFEEDRLSPPPDQVWWSQLYGWPCYTRVLSV